MVTRATTRVIIVTTQGVGLPNKCVTFQSFSGVCIAVQGQRVAFWLWGAQWATSSTTQSSDRLCKLYMLFSFSSLIEFPTISSPVPSYDQVMLARSHSQLAMPQVFATAAYSKGFACSAGPGRVLLFEKMEEKDFYRESREIRVRREGRSRTGGSSWITHVISISRALTGSLLGGEGGNTE